MNDKTNAKNSALSDTIADIDARIVAVESQLASLRRQKLALMECEKMLTNLTHEQGLSEVPQKNIVIVGAEGEMGRVFVDFFKQYGLCVTGIERDDWERHATAFSNADLVLLCVPIDAVHTVCQMLPRLPNNCVLADITSKKQQPMEVMLSCHHGPVLGMHPMFGPDIDKFTGQTFVACEGRMAEKSLWLLELLRFSGAEVVASSAKEHDETMAFVQALRHFTTFVYGLYLKQRDVDLSNLLAFSSPIYRLELMMVGRLFAQNADLYGRIIFDSKLNSEVITGYLNTLSDAVEMLQEGDFDRFKVEFANIRSWMGELTREFLNDSHELLKQSQNIIESKKKLQKKVNLAPATV